MSNFNFSDFKIQVDESLLRHKSILDIVSKSAESNAKINRAIMKSVTSCGCIEINAKKQDIPNDITFADLSKYMDSHISGTLCNQCREKIEEELGTHLFYITAICNLLNIELEDVLKSESSKLKTLGIFRLL